MQCKIAICCLATCVAFLPAVYSALARSADSLLNDLARTDQSRLLGRGSFQDDLLVEQLVYLLPDEGDGKGASIFNRAGAGASDRTLLTK